MFSIVARRFLPRVDVTTRKTFAFCTSSVNFKIPMNNEPQPFNMKDKECASDSSSDEISQIYCERLHRMLTDFQEMDTKPSNTQFTIMLVMVSRLSSRFPSRTTKPSLMEDRVRALLLASAANRQEIDKLINRKAFVVYQAVVHSLVVIYRVKSTTNIPHPALMRLHVAANECPFRLFVRSDTKAVRDYKLHKSLAMLRTMNEGCAQKFREKYGESFVSDVIDHFKNYDFSQVTQDSKDIKCADTFWRITM